jgi:hypothetical protein
VDDVGHVPLAGSRCQRARGGQRARDHPLALLPLPGVAGQQVSRLRVRACRADQDGVDGRAARQYARGDASEPGEQLARIRIGQQRLWVRLRGEAGRVGVAGDRGVKQGLQERQLG